MGATRFSCRLESIKLSICFFVFTSPISETKLGQKPSMQEKSLLQLDWSICLFRPNSVSKGKIETQLDLIPQSPHPSQTKSLINILMVLNSNKIGTLFGLVFGLLSALGFSIFSVSLRWRKETPTFTTVAIAGLFCAVFSFFVLIFTDANFFTTFRNSSLSALHGLLVVSGLILYSIGSKNLPAAELTLLSLTEIIGGIFWVWLPIFGINEVPSANTIIGGFIITFAIFYYSFHTQRNRRFIGLN